MAYTRVTKHVVLPDERNRPVVVLKPESRSSPVHGCAHAVRVRDTEADRLFRFAGAALLPSDEPWEAIIASRVPVLVTGTTAALASLVDALEPLLPEPVVDLDCRHGLPFTEFPQSGTVLLRHVERCTLTVQSQLLECLRRKSDHTQVVSTTPRPLAPLIGTGIFLETLYYRLNTVYVAAARTL
jgi:hypothetical protein